MDDKNKLQIQDIDSYENLEDQVYSHQSLVMKGMRRVYELGAVELNEGCDVKEFINNKAVVIHKPNQRVEFINAIKVLKSGMICDFDEEIKNKLKGFKTGLEKAKKNLLELQVKVWNDLDRVQRQNLNLTLLMPGIFHVVLPYGKKYKELELEYFRNIFEELILLTKRKAFYSSEMVEG